MVMALMTYAKIDTYRYFTLTQFEFEKYMRFIERGYINQSAQKWYDSTVANSTSGGGAGAAVPPKLTASGGVSANQTPSTNGARASTDNTDTSSQPINKAKSSTHLNIRILINPVDRAADEKLYQQVRQWTKNLMTVLYKDQRFFLDMMQTRPSFMDEILDNLYQTVQNLPLDQKIKKVNDLANLTLGNGLEETFYFMLKGCPNFDLASQPLFSPPLITENVNTSIQNQDDDADNAQEAEEYSAGKGYSSILNYVTLGPSGQIRVYLASKELLLAIFGQPDVVDNIINTRYQLYLQVKRDDNFKASEATQQFANQFKGSIQNADESLFDFKVSKTNPRDYD